MSKQHGIRNTVIACLAVIALVSGIFFFQHLQMSKKIDQDKFHGTYLEPARELSDFQLMGTDQKPFDKSALKGQWTLMFFGFTNCGHVCPVTMGELAKMYRLLESKEIKHMPQVVMVSIDPARDSLEKLGQYVLSFDRHFYGARGDAASVEKMTREMGIVYTKVMNKDGKDYDVQHSGAIMLFDPQGQLRAFFTGPHQAKFLAEDYMQLVS